LLVETCEKRAPRKRRCAVARGNPNCPLFALTIALFMRRSIGLQGFGILIPKPCNLFWGSGEN
jgi:hypothetical protein